LIGCTKEAISAPERPSLVLRVLASKPAHWLGAISYSLYLVHYPLLELFWNATIGIAMPDVGRALLMYVVFVPLALLVGRVFAGLFERPFLRQNRSGLRRTAESIQGARLAP
jgi:peptidoglycan/LPS O-acetylase OafA/YrhL